MNFLKRFREDSSGAVSVDWVVLTAGVVALALVGYVRVSEETNLLSDRVATSISTASEP
ncbi:Flp family type IVb pilin [Seohaeicola saemankumensis]|uniref:Flp family type IVb pilin n=2 Tax=Seohaeicola saemankumensis TaxID=481181 RepID=A0ABW3T8U1_9RHOB